ncbi:MAG: 3-oxoacyl-[acyl-carrier-protein] reductase [Planctomycetota bacterium]
MAQKNALVTGAARGIGRAIAEKLAARGFGIVIFDLIPDGQQTAVEIAARFKVPCDFHQVDVTDLAKVTVAVEAVLAARTTIDVLVNNAGITRDNLMLRMDEADWDLVLKVNLKSVFVCTKAVARYMLKQKGGSIVNIASVIGLMGNAGQANYAASKAGIIGLTKANAKEFARKGVRVNAVAPGYIQTKMTEALTEEQKAAILRYVPLQRMGTPADVADAVAFLAGDDSAYMTGQVLVVDGGLVM